MKLINLAGIIESTAFNVFNEKYPEYFERESVSVEIIHYDGGLLYILSVVFKYPLDVNPFDTLKNNEAHALTTKSCIYQEYRFSLEEKNFSLLYNDTSLADCLKEGIVL